MCAMSEVPVVCEAARLMALWASGFVPACGASSAQTRPRCLRLRQVMLAMWCRGRWLVRSMPTAAGALPLEWLFFRAKAGRVLHAASAPWHRVPGWNGSMENMRPQLLLNWSAAQCVG